MIRRSAGRGGHTSTMSEIGAAARACPGSKVMSRSLQLAYLVITLASRSVGHKLGILGPCDLSLPLRNAGTCDGCAAQVTPLIQAVVGDALENVVAHEIFPHVFVVEGVPE